MKAPLQIPADTPLGMAFLATCAVFGITTIAGYRALTGDRRQAFECAWTDATRAEAMRRGVWPEETRPPTRGPYQRRRSALVESEQLRARRAARDAMDTTHWRRRTA